MVQSDSFFQLVIQIVLLRRRTFSLRRRTFSLRVRTFSVAQAHLFFF